MRILGDRVLVALEPTPDERTTESGLVLIADPDTLRTPTRGIVVALGDKRGQVDLDEARSEIHEWFLGSDDLKWEPHEIRDQVDMILMKLQPAGFDVSVGDCVVFPSYAGEQFEQDGIEYVVVRESEILGTVSAIKDTAA